LPRPTTRSSDDEARRLDDMADRRLAGEPVSRIFAEREFYDRVFTIGPASLDPRPDTETLVERALAFARTHSFQRSPAGPAILDLGTGSGAILVTLLAELPDARGTGTDLSPAALDEARANAARHGVAERARFVAADWCSGIEGRFDLIVSNPPYIPSDEIPLLDGKSATGIRCLRSTAGRTGSRPIATSPPARGRCWRRAGC
jgi:release factor glutamine methyltransferase